MVLEHSARKGGVVTAQVNSLRRWALVVAVTIVVVIPLRASDHADPLDYFNRRPQEPGITDLFVFPRGDQLVVILCVRRHLTNRSLNLEPYTYTINMDLKSTVTYENEEQIARYGGTVVKPENISPTVTIAFRLMNDASVRDQTITGIDRPERIKVWTGVRDDPFIFPPFFGTNVVAMVLSIPRDAFSREQRDWIVWATTSRRGQQIDHVGRSLRTQNPRFDILNTLAPKDHVPAIARARAQPKFISDFGIYFKLDQVFRYRHWDDVPDVMIYTERRPVGFPNGRLLTDDVAELLAVYGDTLLKELSYVSGHWPRQTKNDKAFMADFPYLAEPWPDSPPRKPYHPSRRNQLIAVGGTVLILGTPFLLGWLIAYLHYRRKFRLRYL
jgi:uncharacterized protein DUF4331